MSATVAKSKRRELRRAFGPAAVDTVSHIDQGLDNLTKSCELQRQAIVSLVEWRNRPLWGRFVWLVTGR